MTQTQAPRAALAAVARIELFASLPAEYQQVLAERLKPRALGAGEVLFREGDEGDALFIIQSGSVLVYTTDKTFGLTSELARLGPGQAVGEMALLSEAPRSASVRADEGPAELLVLERRVFRSLVRRRPDVALQIAGVLAGRLERLNRTQGIQFGSLRNRRPSEALRGLIPEALVRRHQMFPVERSGRTVTLATPDPGNLLGLDDIRRVLRGMEIRLMAVSESDWSRFIEAQLSGGEAAPRGRSTGAEAQRRAPGRLRYRRPQQLVRDERRPPSRGTEVSDLVSNIFIEAVERSASDILIEPEAHGVTVRYRVNGALVHRPGEIPAALHAPILSRIKILADMDITERRLPQDGRIGITIDGQSYDLRVATVNTSYGERVGVRVLDASRLGAGIDSLILASEVAYAVRNLIYEPNGLVLITGPTGSGKTTTLYSALQERNVPELSICTVEDPVEYDLPGISQVPISEELGLGWAAVLRTFLRQSPDIILVGETRDAVTARMVCNAALTGHLVLSSFHTNDALSAVVRLGGMGVEPYVLATCLKGVINQRLVLRLCPECAAPHRYPGVVYRNLRNAGVVLEEGAQLYRSAGCRSCHDSGYSGRIGVYEVLLGSTELRDAISARAGLDELRAAAPEGTYMPLTRYSAFLLARGMTTPEEIIRILPGEEEDR